MERNPATKKLYLPLTIAVNLLLASAVVFLMQYVQTQLENDVKINLTEVVTQNKDVITGKLNIEINNLKSAAQQIAVNALDAELSDDYLHGAIREYSRVTGETQLFLATKGGTAFFSDGTALDISARSYFKIALEGNDNISERIISRLNGEEIFVISVPILYNERIAGTMQKSYTPEEMYEICSVSLFSDQGSMYIINTEGYILISSEIEEYSHESENLYRILYVQGNQAESRKLESDIQNSCPGFMQTVLNGEKIFSAYTPIDKVHDWYLVSNIASGTVSSNTQIVIKLFYIILLAVVLIFAVSILYFLSYKNIQQANLEHIAFVDSVTGGKTFTKFSLDMRKILNEFPEKQFFFLAFDVDNFKYINSFYGFEFGDRMLRNINSTLEKQLHAPEIIARVSGDHFVILLDEAQMERLSRMHNSIQNVEEATMYFSAGLYKITNPTESVHLMLDKAGMAAQTIKGNMHKIVAVYTEKFDRQMIHNERLKLAIKKALENDEFIPYFQPKINIHTGAIAGAEALARWKMQDGKLIPPGDFIPFCEKNGLVVEIDLVIFEKTLRFMRKNLDAGAEPIPISINFSRLHLNDNDFIDKIMDKIYKYDIPPHLIELELTESVIFDHHEIIADFITTLHNKGLQLSMDDFGSGYSSLNMLKDFPIDVLKIDRGFLNETADKTKRDIIFSSIARMANSLNIKIVVEGVETEEHVTLMKDFDCSIAQGFYFSKPLDEHTFEHIYGTGNLCLKQ